MMEDFPKFPNELVVCMQPGCNPGHPLTPTFCLGIAHNQKMVSSDQVRIATYRLTESTHPSTGGLCEEHRLGGVQGVSASDCVGCALVTRDRTAGRAVRDSVILRGALADIVEALHDGRTQTALAIAMDAISKEKS